MRRTLLALILLSSTALPVLAEKRVALVMAADDYEKIRPLENAVNDAQAIEEKLEALGFEVTLETDRDLKRMRRALEDFREDADGADVALVYFAGHGVEIGGENRLLPTDADAASIDALKESSLPLEEIRKTVAEVGKVGLVMLDACRNDPFGMTAANGSRGAAALEADVVADVKPGLGRLGEAENLLYSFSAAPGATAADGSGENSPFTGALVKYLGTDGLEIRSVLTLVQQEVYDLSRGSQLPYVENGLPKMFFASAQAGDLPERERLLLAMADVSTDLRDEVERLAKEKDMPLAPLYGALISSDAQALSNEDRARKLTEAADAFVSVRTQMKTMASSDPAVASLRDEAEKQLALGAFDGARRKLAEAASIDSQSRDALKANYVGRTTSEAATHLISGGASRTNLKYALAIESYQKAASLFEEVDKQDLSQADRKQQLQTYETLGDLHRTVGDLKRARDAFERGGALSHRLSESDPATAEWRSGIAKFSYELGGVLVDLGDTEAALNAYTESMQLHRELSEREPENSDIKALLAADFMKIGLIYYKRGEPDKALASYESARDMAKTLIDSGYRGNGVEGTLPLTYTRLGEVFSDKSENEAARSAMETSVTVAESLLNADPGNVDRQFQVAASLDSLGNLLMRQKLRDEALNAYVRSHAMLTELSKKDPVNTRWRRSIALTTERMGDLAFEQGKRDEALQLYGESTKIREALVASDPANALWQGDLAWSYDKQGGMYTAIFDDLKAIEYYERALGPNEKLAGLDRTNVDWQRAVTFSLRKVGWSLWQAKEWPKAHDYLDRRAQFAKQASEAAPEVEILRSDVVVAHNEIADMYDREKDTQRSLQAYEAGLAAARVFAERNPDKFNDVSRVSRSMVSVADTQFKLQKDPEALENYRAALEWAQKADKLKPDDAAWQRQISLIHNRIGGNLEIMGDLKGALAAFNDGIFAIDKAIALDPMDADFGKDRDYGLGRIAKAQEKQAAAGKP